MTHTPWPDPPRPTGPEPSWPRPRNRRRPIGPAGLRPRDTRPRDNRPGTRPWWVELEMRHELAASTRPADRRPPPRPVSPPPPNPANPDRPRPARGTGGGSFQPPSKRGGCLPLICLTLAPWLAIAAGLAYGAVTS